MFRQFCAGAPRFAALPLLLMLLCLPSCAQRAETVRRGVDPVVTGSLPAKVATALPPAENGAVRAASGIAGDLTLEAAVRMAIAWHPSLKGAMASLESREEGIAAARAGYLPKVGAGIVSDYDSSGSDGKGVRPKAELSLSQMVFDFGKVSSGVEAASARRAESRANLLDTVDVLARDTARALIEVQRNRALLAVARQQAQGVRSIAGLVRTRSESGAGTRSDMLQAQARADAADAAQQSIAADLLQWEGSLARLLGLAGAPPVAPGMPKALEGACETAAPDWDGVPAIMRAAARQRLAMAEESAAKAERWPTLALKVGASYDLDPSNAASTRYDPREPQFTIGLGITGNLYDPAMRARSAATGYEREVAKAAEGTARFEAMRGLEEARSRASGLRMAQAPEKARIATMEKTRSLYRLQYERLGTRTLLELLNAEQELHGAQFDAVRTEHDLRQLHLSCLYHAGAIRRAVLPGGTILAGVSL